MAQLRLIGEPAEIEAILAAIGTTVDVSDLSPGRSRRNPSHILMYGHVAAPDRPATLTAIQIHEHDAVETPGKRALPRGK